MSESVHLTHAVNNFLEAMEHEGDEGRHRRSPTSRLVDDCLQACLDGEYMLRQLFATDPTNINVQGPYISLFDILDISPKAKLARPRPWNVRKSFTLSHNSKNFSFPLDVILPVKPHLRRMPGSPCIVDDLPAFETVWKQFTGGAFSGIKNWDNIVVAGGSVLACLTPPCLTNPSWQTDGLEELFEIYQTFPYQNSDIDVFLLGLTEAKAKAKMEEIFQAIKSTVSYGKVVCFRTKNTITIQAPYPRCPIQLVMRLYRSLSELLGSIDVDNCCVAYNGVNVFTTPRGLTAIVRQCNTIDLTRRSPSYEHRLAKYSERGYEIFYPDLRRADINYYRLSNPNRTTFPNGLARLMVYEIMSVDILQFPSLYEGWDNQVLFSPPQIENLRPSSYNYAWVKIPYGARWWDVRKVRQHVEKKGADIIHYQGRGKHLHVITSGTMAECLERCCGVTKDGGEDEENLANGFFRGPALFIVDDPGRQTTGSFNPIGNDDIPDYKLWEFEAYRDGDSDSDASK